jgi:aspartate/methionine/tyrosine aminotransferase
VVPEPLVPVMERLAQNFFICAPTPAQRAALACFTPDSLAVCETRRQVLAVRRERVLQGLAEAGLPVPVRPDGAFYAWADCGEAARRLGVEGSWDFAFEVMRRAHVAVTPGRDFGQAQTGRFVRFSTASSMAQLQEAAARLKEALG